MKDEGGMVKDEGKMTRAAAEEEAVEALHNLALEARGRHGMDWGVMTVSLDINMGDKRARPTWRARRLSRDIFVPGDTLDECLGQMAERTSAAGLRSEAARYRKMAKNCEGALLRLVRGESGIHINTDAWRMRTSALLRELGGLHSRAAELEMLAEKEDARVARKGARE